MVLDANILIRAVLGSRVRPLLRKYEDRVSFATPDVMFQEARAKLGEILARRSVAATVEFEVLNGIGEAIQVLGPEIYGPFEQAARERIDRRDSTDWPVLASALALDCPIWTEDTDFFGCGVATWTSDRVEMYLAAMPPSSREDAVGGPY